MIGQPTTTTFSAHSFYRSTPNSSSKIRGKIMPRPKRKLAMVEMSDHETEERKPILGRRVSKRVKNIKVEKDLEESIPTHIKVKPEPLHENASDSENDDSDMSNYERTRLKNIEENAKFFASLEIFKAKEDLAISSGTSKKTTSSRGLQPAKNKKIDYSAMPKRPRSLRLQRIDPDGTQLPLAPQTYITSENLHERKPSEPSTMIPMNVSEESKENCSKDFINMMTALSKSPNVSASTGSSKQQTTSDVQTFRKSLVKMRITPERVAKVVKDRVFSVAVHPSTEKVLVCAGDKWGKIGLWDVESKDSKDNGVFLFEPHSRPVNCLKFAPGNPNKLYSTSYDGTVRCGDFEKGVFDEVYATPDDENTLTKYLDFLSPDGSQLLVSQSNRGGFIAVVDTRTRSGAEHVYYLHEKIIKTVSVHPLRKHCFATASSDSTVKIWDLRTLKDNTQRICTPIVSLQHGKYMTSAYFSPLTGCKLLTSSGDDKFRIFNCAESGDVLTAQLSVSIRHNNHTGRWLTAFRPTWHPNREDVFVSGSMARPRQIEVFDDKGSILHNFLDEESLGSVCSLNAFHPTRNVLVGANSSGRLHVFM